MIDEHEELGYITLKQASERFGYSPDYIGQLIRKGKIEGKQVYANVAWMTTEAAIREYIDGAGNVKVAENTAMFDQVTQNLFSDKATRYLTWTLRALVGLLIIIGVLVFYFLSISIDDTLSKRAERALVLRMNMIQAHASVAIIPPSPVAYGE